MSKKTPQDYANELLKMYRENSDFKTASTENVVYPPQPKPSPDSKQFKDGIGGLQINVTTFGRLYPVNEALITVFTGDMQNKTVIKTGYTDQSGKSNVFELSAPPSSFSQQQENNGSAPFSRYNVSVKSDGYVEQIAINVPVFSGVISVQGIDLLPISAAGGNLSPQIIQEGSDYNL